MIFYSFRFTCRGLFERHKLLFSFQMCAKILEAAGKLNMDEYNFFLRGGVVGYFIGGPKMSGNFVHCKRERQRIVHIVYVNNTLPLALAVHEISRHFWAAYGYFSNLTCNKT